MALKIRKLDESASFGEQIQKLRKSMNWTLSEMAEKTKIRKSFLQAFEDGDHEKLPEPLYSRQFLRRYVKALGGDEEYFLQRFDDERGTCDFLGTSILPIRKTRLKRFLSVSKFSKIAVLVCLIFAIATYLGTQIYSITKPPEITLINPIDGLKTQEATIFLEGKTNPEAHLFLNGSSVLLNKDGSFNVPIALERGANIITLESSTKHSRTATLYRRVIFTESTPEHLTQL